MNNDILFDLLVVLKSKKSYDKYSKLRIVKSLICGKCKSLADPTILEFKFDKNYILVLHTFIKRGSISVFWGNQTVEVYCSNTPLSIFHAFKKGTHKIKIFSENNNTILSSGYFDKEILLSSGLYISNPCKNMVNFIKIGKEFVDLSRLFYNCPKLNAHLNHLDLANVTNTSSMFYGALNFNQQIGDWDVSNVTDMTSMFNSASSFNQSITEWDVSHVAYMDFMFNGAISFNQPVGEWNVSNVRNMRHMFLGATSFNQPIENWNVSNVGDMSYMFYRATSFNQPIGKWDVSNVAIMSYMFCGALSFNKKIGNWDIQKLTKTDGMFSSSDGCDGDDVFILF